MRDSNFNNRIGWIILALALLSCTIGCGTSPTQIEKSNDESSPIHIAQPENVGNADAVSPLGSIPFPLDIERLGSGLSIKTVAGGDYQTDLPSMNVPSGNPGEPVEFQPGTDGDNLAFAMYHLRKSEWNSYTLVTSTWSVEPTQWDNLWIGATDWNLGGWKWFEGKSLGKIGALDRLFDSEGDVYIAVVLLGDDPATLDMLELTQGYAGPTPILHTSNNVGYKALTVTFDGSDSYSTQGKIVKYLWNFQDGTALQDTTSPVMHYTYSNAGYSYARLTVEDEEGNRYGTNSETVAVKAPNTAMLSMSQRYNDLWGSGPVDVNGLPGLLVIEENYDAEEGEPEAFLKFTRAIDLNGIEWTDPVLIAELSDFEDEYITDQALAMINGAPAAVYTDPSNSYVMYVRATDSIGLNWADPVVVSVGGEAKLTTIDDTPAIFYGRSNHGYNICFAYNANGTSWQDPVPIATNQFFGGGTGLVFIDGIPAVSWCEGTFYGPTLVYFATATDSTGMNWNSPVLAYSTEEPQYEDITQYLMVINSRPVLGLYIKDSRGPDTAMYLVAEDSEGQVWGSGQIVDDEILEPAIVFRGGFDPFGVEKVAVIFPEFMLLVPADGTGNLDWEHIKHINTYGIAEYQPVRTSPDFLETGRFWYKKREKTWWNDYYMSAVFKTLLLD